MHTEKHEIKMGHPLANIKIQLLNDIDPICIKNLITLALESYELSKNVPASILHAEIKNKNPRSYNTLGCCLHLFRSRANLSQEQLA